MLPGKSKKPERLGHGYLVERRAQQYMLRTMRQRHHCSNVNATRSWPVLQVKLNIIEKLVGGRGNDDRFWKKGETGHKWRQTNCDLGMLDEDSKSQMPGQGVLDQTFFFKNKTKKPKPPNQKNPPPHPSPQPKIPKHKKHQTPLPPS